VARMGKGKVVYRVLWESPKEKDHLKDQGVDGRMGSKWTLERLAGGVEWIHLAQDSDRWRAVVNAVMSPRHAAEVWTSEKEAYRLVTTGWSRPSFVR
jgi:hypothetical protein